jgi:hypothetical protein
MPRGLGDKNIGLGREKNNGGCIEKLPSLTEKKNSPFFVFPTHKIKVKI